MRRVRTRTGVEFAGRAIEHAVGVDGIEIGPAGEELRQVVQEHRIAWECSTWSQRRVLCTTAATTHSVKCLCGLRPDVSESSRAPATSPVVGRDSDLKRVMRLTRCVALAWVEPPRTSVRIHACPLPGLEAVADNIVWIRAGLREFQDDGIQQVEPVPQPSTHDQWRPLRYVWRNACGEITQRVDESTKPAEAAYHVSLRGWVRTPFGTFTKGALAHWAAVRVARRSRRVLGRRGGVVHVCAK